MDGPHSSPSRESCQPSPPTSPARSKASTPESGSGPSSPDFSDVVSSPFPRHSPASSPVPCEVLSSPFKQMSPVSSPGRSEVPSSPLRDGSSLPLRVMIDPPVELGYIEVHHECKRLKLEDSGSLVSHFSNSLPQIDDQQQLEVFCRTEEDQIFILNPQHMNENQEQQQHLDSLAMSGSDSSSAESMHDSSLSSSEDIESVISSAEECAIESSEAEQEGSDDESGVHVSPKVFEGCDITQDECVLNFMELFVKSKMSKTQMGGVLTCILKLLPKNSNIPKTEYGLFNYVKKFSPITEEKVQTHFYCSECLFYLGQTETSCTLCSGVSHKFFQIPLADQIQNLFEHHGLADLIDKYAEERNSSDLGDDSFRDLLDGSEFKRAHIEGSYNLTLMGHTDGISVSDSSDASLWPLEWVVAQIPPRLRFKYVFVSGIWLDVCKPNMNSMLKPFVAELQNLHEAGVRWVHPRTGQMHITRIAVPSFCVDAPVRAQLQNIQIHGGKHCCHVCEQKMKKLPPQPVIPGEKRPPRRRVYTFEEVPATLRSHERMEEQGKEARRNKVPGSTTLVPVKGVKGLSAISDIPGCDRSTAVFPEYMHLILCVIKEFMTLWFEKPGPWRLTEHQRDIINQFLKSIQVPDFITRIPRSTVKFSSWKANELRSFLLFFSVIILSKCMKPEYFQHWLALVAAISLLVQETVSKVDVMKANLLLRLFCRDFSKLYSDKYYTYYIHNLIHLGLLVERHGPLHSNSAFMFESFNGVLAKYIHGTKNQGKELVHNVILALGTEVLKAKCLKQNNNFQAKNNELRSQIKGFTFNKTEFDLLSALAKYKEPMKAFYRAAIKWEIYTCSLYKRQTKRNNYTICYLNSSGNKVFGEIMYFIESLDEKMALVKKFEIDHLRTFCHDATNFVFKHIIPISPTDVIDVIDLSAILFKVIRVGKFVCLRPNTVEYNL